MHGLFVGNFRLSRLCGTSCKESREGGITSYQNVNASSLFLCKLVSLVRRRPWVGGRVDVDVSAERMLRINLIRKERSRCSGACKASGANAAAFPHHSETKISNIACRISNSGLCDATELPSDS